VKRCEQLTSAKMFDQLTLNQTRSIILTLVLLRSIALLVISSSIVNITFTADQKFDILNLAAAGSKRKLGGKITRAIFTTLRYLKIGPIS